MNYIQESEKYLLPTYTKYPIQISHGKGSYIWDTNGKKYLDFYGGHAVCLLGHSPTKVVKSIEEQSKKLIFYSNIFHTKPAIELSKVLSESLLPKKYKVYFANSGSEANETAIKIVRKYSGKKHIISFKDSFHGRSITSLAVTGIDHYHDFQPNLNHYTSFAIHGDLSSVKKCIKKDTAAIICEPIQSIGGVNMANKSFYKDLRKLCDQKEILLIFDEVQTGLGRTGSTWFSKEVGVYPDIITTAKGIASGLPLSAVIVNKKVSMSVKAGDQATTFGGGPLVCAAGIATLKPIFTTSFLNKVKEKSTYLFKELHKIPEVKDVLGKGLLIGIQLHKEHPKIVKMALEKGIIIGSSMKKDVVRIMPPLNINKQEIDLFLNRFRSIL